MTINLILEASVEIPLVRTWHLNADVIITHDLLHSW